MVYKVAIIGTGRIGFSLGTDKKREQPASHTMALKENKQIRLVAGVDTDPQALERWVRYNKNAAAFSSIDNLSDSKKFDIITIAVNEASHLSITLKAICLKPKIIILEKPVALNMEEALKIKEYSLINNVPIIVNHERLLQKS